MEAGNMKNNESKQEIDKDWPQILAILSACVSALSAGLLFSWPSPFILVITKDKENYDITEEEASYFTIIPPIGMICASLIFFKLNDIIGRKKTILLMAIPQITFWITCMFARNIYTFYLVRLFGGFGDAALFASVPVYIGEVATPKVRGLWGNAMTFSIYSGQLLINIFGSYLDVKQTAYCCIFFPLLFVLSFIQMPESPYFYILKGRHEDARKSLRFLRGKNNVEDDFHQLKSDVERQMSESGTWKDLVTIKSNRRALGAGIFLRFSQQMGGISVFATYTQLIFEKSAGNVSPQLSSIIFMGLCCGLNLIAAFSLDHLGRRRAYFYSLLTTGFVLLIESVYFYLDQVQTTINVASFNWVPLTGMIIYTIFYSLGLGIVPTLMLGELFSSSIKGKGLCVLNIMFGICVFITTNMFNLLNTYVGLFAPFLFFSVSCFVSSILTMYFVPETKGKTLEEIQQSLKESRKKVLEMRRRSRTI